MAAYEVLLLNTAIPQIQAAQAGDTYVCPRDIQITANLNVTGNTTLGDASTDTVRVNGYMGVGGAPASNIATYIRNSALTGATQHGIVSSPVGSTAGTSEVSSVSGQPGTSASAYTVANVYSFWAFDALKGAGSTITNLHGLYVRDLTQGTNNYGITSIVSSGTNKWNIYASGTAANYFAGDTTFFNGTTGTKTIALDGSLSSTSVLNQDFLGGGTGNPSARIQFTSANKALSFWTGDLASISEKMRIDSSGNVGIGTSAPDSYNVLGGTLAAVAGTGISNVSIVSGASSTGNILFADGTSGDERRAGRIAYDHSVNNLYFFTNGNSLRATIDSSGNLGLGVTPSAWDTTFTAAFQIGGAALTGTSGNNTALASNAYYNLGWRYYGTTTATLFQQISGQHRWFTAPSGTAGAAITFTERANIGLTEMVVNEPGNDYDFRVESDTNTHALFVDAGNSRVGINNSAPTQALTVSDNASTPVAFARTSNTVGQATYIALQANNASNNAVTYASAGSIIDVNTAGAHSGSFSINTALSAAITERVRVKSTGQVRFVPLAADPAGAEAGDVYYNSGTNKLRLYDGTSWVDLN